MAESRREGPPACNTSDPADARRFQDRALKLLKAKGLRITGPRTEVIRTLSETNAALSPYSIHERLTAEGRKLDVVSVYRILSTLLDFGLVHHIGLVDGYYACRADHDREHSAEHLVCDSCGCVTEVESQTDFLQSLLARAASYEFSPRIARIEVIGRCAHCVNK